MTGKPADGTVVGPNVGPTAAPTAVQDWDLERYRLGELPAPDVERVGRALAGDDGARARLDVLARSDGEILAAHPPAAVTAAIRARLVGSPEPARHAPIRRHDLAYGLAFSFALVTAGAVVVPRLLSVRTDETIQARDTTRIKGLAPRLLVYRMGPTASIELLASHSVAR